MNWKTGRIVAPLVALALCFAAAIPLAACSQQGQEDNQVSSTESSSTEAQVLIELNDFDTTANLIDEVMDYSNEISEHLDAMDAEWFTEKSKSLGSKTEALSSDDFGYPRVNECRDSWGMAGRYYALSASAIAMAIYSYKMNDEEAYNEHLKEATDAITEANAAIKRAREIVDEIEMEMIGADAG